MANHCYNWITFKGNDVSKIKEMMLEAIEVNKEQGWLPKEVEGGFSRYLFDVYINDDCPDFLSVQCWTKWSPPLDELVIICKLAGVSCVCNYEECGMMIYGEFEYLVDEDISVDTYLDEKDFDRVVYDEENDVYLFDGKVVDSDTTAYQEMLDEKLFSIKK